MLGRRKMSRRINRSIEQIKAEFAERGYQLLANTYDKTTTKMPYICKKHPEHGVQHLSYTKFKSNRGCYKCGRERTLAAQRHDHEHVRKQFEKRNMLLITNEYFNASQKLEFICNHHADKGIQTMNYRQLYATKECKYCSMQRLSEKFKYGFEYVAEVFSNANLKLVSEKYLGNNCHLDFICEAHPELGVQTTSLTTVKNGGTGCRSCLTKKLSQKQRWTNDKFLMRVADIHGDSIMPLDTYNGNGSAITFCCTRCNNIWRTTPNSITGQKTGCPLCASSKGEKRIAKYLSNIGVSFQVQKEYDDLVGVSYGKLSYDFYIPCHNLLIEYQGQFHDGTASYQTEAEFKKQVEHDRRKRQYAQKLNINLLEIWYHDFDRIENILSEVLC